MHSGSATFGKIPKNNKMHLHITLHRRTGLQKLLLNRLRKKVYTSWTCFIRLERYSETRNYNKTKIPRRFVEALLSVHTPKKRGSRNLFCINETHKKLTMKEIGLFWTICWKYNLRTDNEILYIWIGSGLCTYLI